MTKALKLLLRIQNAVPRTGVQSDNRRSPDKSKIIEPDDETHFCTCYIKALLRKIGSSDVTAGNQVLNQFLSAVALLTFWHRSFTFNSNKSPTWCNNFSIYYPEVCLQLNMFRAFSRPLSGAQWLQWQPLVLPSYRGDSRVVFVVGPAGRPDHENSAAITTIRR